MVVARLHRQSQKRSDMFVDRKKWGSFLLSDDFVKQYSNTPVRWGYGDLSWVTFKRTYSRNNEEWWQTCERVVNGFMTLLKIHCKSSKIYWDQNYWNSFAQDAYHRLFRFQWTPPGRGLWMMGTDYIFERGGEALNNCGFVSTKDIDRDFKGPFVWLFGMSMLGVGVGFDTRGASKISLSQPEVSKEPFIISDSREGWKSALATLLDSFVGLAKKPQKWDFTKIRRKGTKLESFGGYASGPEPLRLMLESVDAICSNSIGRPVDSTFIVDTMNLIGKCVVAGGIRRTAQIALGEPTDQKFVTLKSDKQKLMDYRWASNNSVFVDEQSDFKSIVKNTLFNGEPGLVWLDKIRNRGRIADPPDYADSEAMGTNPCAEQTLWDKELCCLVETYPANHESLEDFRKTLHTAYVYAKTVTLMPIADPDTHKIVAKNRRIGCSLSGIVQAISKFGEEEFLAMCDTSYQFLKKNDQEFSSFLNVNRSIKLTSVKPSGTVSLLAGASPGVHWDHAPYYIRRVRLTRDHPLIELCKSAGYKIEKDQYSENTSIIQFPIKSSGQTTPRSEVSMETKLSLAGLMQTYWSDNQVSCTVDIPTSVTEQQLEELLKSYSPFLKSISFIPQSDQTYEQMPYETISRERYEELTSELKPISGRIHHDQEDNLCDLEFCYT